MAPLHSQRPPSSLKAASSCKAKLLTWLRWAVNPLGGSLLGFTKRLGRREKKKKHQEQVAFQCAVRLGEGGRERRKRHSLRVLAGPKDPPAPSLRCPGAPARPTLCPACPAACGVWGCVQTHQWRCRLRGGVSKKYNLTNVGELAAGKPLLPRQRSLSESLGKAAFE